MGIIAIMAFIMGLERASVAHAKNTLSNLINKVAYGKTRILLESRGKPKAALVSTEDLERLERLEAGEGASEVRLHILAQAQLLRRKIQRRRKKWLSDSADLLNRLREKRDRGG
jgi:prevent-host-death family protein